MVSYQLSRRKFLETTGMVGSLYSLSRVVLHRKDSQSGFGRQQKSQ